MAIQIIEAPDGNPPKLKILKTFAPSKRKKNYMLFMLALVVIFTFFQWKGSSDSLMFVFFKNLMITFAFNVPVIFIWGFISQVKGVAKSGGMDGFGSEIHHYYKNVFIQHGYQVDFEAKGIVVDTAQRKIGFTTSPTGLKKENGIVFSNMLVCDFGDVRKWYTQSKAIQGRHGSVGSVHSINVEIAYPASPLQGFDVMNDYDASQWIARLTSLING